MTTEQNKATGRRFLDEVAGRGNLAVIDEIYGPNYIDHSLPPGVPATNEGAKGFWTMFRAAFPDLHYSIDDEVAEGDRLVQRITGHGTMRGDFQGMPASGKEATWSEIHVVRFNADGKAIEHWGVVDQLGMLVQLGFAQAPGQPAGVAE
jgi:predicted ester cyclase